MRAPNIAINKVKCINLDWLSVYCLEPKGAILDAAYYKSLGWEVKKQNYGTPQYQEKFQLLNGKNIFLEIERSPYSLRENGGIFEPESCHIRLSNRTCYARDAITQLIQFIIKYGYTYKGISRIDLCCDLTIFDNGMKPQDLANRYMADKIWKVHQSKLFAHSMDGDDTWRIPMEIGAFGRETKTGRSWNSLKWGSPRSAISTKLYNKSLELQNNPGKFYIIDSWVKCGLCELQKVTYEHKNPKTKEIETRAKMICVAPGTATADAIPQEQAQKVDIWRVEFSINSEGRKWVDISDGKRVDLNLSAFDNADVQAMTFYVLQEWLFNFVHAAWVDKGGGKEKQRTNRCKPLKLFNTKFLHSHYKPAKITENENPTRTEKIMLNKLVEKAKNKIYSEEYRDICWKMAKALSKEHGDWWFQDPDPNGRGMISFNIIDERKKLEDKARERRTMADILWIKHDENRDIEDINKLSNDYKRYRQNKTLYNNIHIQQLYKEIQRLVKETPKLDERNEAAIKDLQNILGVPF